MPGGEQVVDPAGEIVPFDVGDLGGQPEPGGELADLGGQAGRVQPARVADDPDPAVQAGAEHLLQLGQEGPGVARVRVLLPGLPQDQHGQLGQVVAGEHVDRPALHHLPGGGDPVAVEARAVADPHRPPRAGRRAAAPGRRRRPPCRPGGHRPSWPDGTGPGNVKPGSRPGPGAPANAWASDIHSVGGRPGDPQPRVGQVPPLGHHQAEVQRRAGDPVRRAGRPPGPRTGVRRGQLDPDRGHRHRPAVQLKGKAEGTDAQVGDVPQPAGGLAHRAERVRDVLAVRPGLHQPGGHRAGRAHVRPVPGQPVARGRARAARPRTRSARPGTS